MYNKIEDSELKKSNSYKKPNKNEIYKSEYGESKKNNVIKKPNVIDINNKKRYGEIKKNNIYKKPNENEIYKSEYGESKKNNVIKKPNVNEINNKIECGELKNDYIYKKPCLYDNDEVLKCLLEVKQKHSSSCHDSNQIYYDTIEEVKADKEYMASIDTEDSFSFSLEHSTKFEDLLVTLEEPKNHSFVDKEYQRNSPCYVDIMNKINAYRAIQNYKELVKDDIEPRNVVCNQGDIYDESDTGDGFISAASSVDSSMVSGQFVDADSGIETEDYSELQVLLDPTRNGTLSAFNAFLDKQAELLFEQRRPILKEIINGVLTTIRLYVHQLLGFMFNDNVNSQLWLIAIEEWENLKYKWEDFVEIAAQRIVNDINFGEELIRRRSYYSLFDSKKTNLTMVERLYIDEFFLRQKKTKTTLFKMSDRSSITPISNKISTTTLSDVDTDFTLVPIQRNCSNSFGDGTNLLQINPSIFDNIINENLEELVKPIVIELIVNHTNRPSEGQSSTLPPVCFISMPEANATIQTVLNEFLDDLIGPSIRHHHIVVCSQNLILNKCTNALKEDLVIYIQNTIIETEEALWILLTNFINSIYENCANTIKFSENYSGFARQNTVDLPAQYCEKFSRKLRISNVNEFVSTSDIKKEIIQPSVMKFDSLTIRNPPSSRILQTEQLLSLKLNDGCDHPQETTSIKLSNLLLDQFEDIMIEILDIFDRIFIKESTKLINATTIEVKSKARVIHLLFHRNMSHYSNAMQTDDYKLSLANTKALASIVSNQILFFQAMINPHLGFFYQTWTRYPCRTIIDHRDVFDSINYVITDAYALFHTILGSILAQSQTYRSIVHLRSTDTILEPDSFFTARSLSYDNYSHPNIEGDSFVATGETNVNNSNQNSDSINYSSVVTTPMLPCIMNYLWRHDLHSVDRMFAMLSNKMSIISVLSFYSVRLFNRDVRTIRNSIQTNSKDFPFNLNKIKCYISNYVEIVPTFWLSHSFMYQQNPTFLIGKLTNPIIFILSVCLILSDLIGNCFDILRNLTAGINLKSANIRIYQMYD